MPVDLWTIANVVFGGLLGWCWVDFGKARGWSMPTSLATLLVLWTVLIAAALGYAWLAARLLL